MPVTYTLGFNADSIKTKGEDRMALRIVTSSGAQSGSETWFDTVYRSTSTITDQQPEEDIRGESGRILVTEQGDETAEIKITSLQTDSNLYNFLLNDVQDNYFAAFIECGETTSSSAQFCYVPLVKVQKGFTMTAPGRTVEITLKPLSPPSSWNTNSLSAGSITAWSSYNAAALSGHSMGAGVMMKFINTP